MGVQSAATAGSSRNRIGACTRGPASWADLDARLGRGGIFSFLPWLARLVGLPNGRVPADGSPGRMDEGRVVRDTKLPAKFKAKRRFRGRCVGSREGVFWF